MGMFSKGLGDTLEEAEKLLNDFYEAFPKVKKYLDKQVVDAMTRGYTQDNYGRVRWYEIPEGIPEEEVRSLQKRIKRQAQNHCTQSLSASVTKLAILHLHNLLKETGWGYMILTVHDSIFFEIKTKHLKEALPEIKRIMESTGPMVMEKLVTPIDFDIGAIIEKTCKISGMKFKVYEYVWDKENGLRNNPQDISEDTEKVLKFLKIPISQDYQGMLAEVVEKVKTMPIEWQQKNQKWIDSVMQR